MVLILLQLVSNSPLPSLQAADVPFIRNSSRTFHYGRPLSSPVSPQRFCFSWSTSEQEAKAQTQPSRPLSEGTSRPTTSSANLGRLPLGSSQGQIAALKISRGRVCHLLLLKHRPHILRMRPTPGLVNDVAGEPYLHVRLLLRGCSLSGRYPSLLIKVLLLGGKADGRWGLCGASIFQQRRHLIAGASPRFLTRPRLPSTPQTTFSSGMD